MCRNIMTWFLVRGGHQYTKNHLYVILVCFSVVSISAQWILPQIYPQVPTKPVKFKTLGMPSHFPPEQTVKYSSPLRGHIPQACLQGKVFHNSENLLREAPARAKDTKSNFLSSDLFATQKTGTDILICNFLGALGVSGNTREPCLAFFQSDLLYLSWVVLLNVPDLISKADS